MENHRTTAIEQEAQRKLKQLSDQKRLRQESEQRALEANRSSPAKYQAERLKLEEQNREMNRILEEENKKMLSLQEEAERVAEENRQEQERKQ